MAEEPKPDDIKDILADLDAILSGLTPEGKQADPGGKPAPEKSAPPIAAKSVDSHPPPKPELKAPAGGVVTPASNAAPKEPSEPASPPPPKSMFEIKPPVERPPRVLASENPSAPAAQPPTAKPPDLEIELAPRAGVIRPPEPVSPPKPAPAPQPKPPIEFDLGEQKPVTSPPATAAQVSPSQAVPPKPAVAPEIKSEPPQPAFPKAAAPIEAKPAVSGVKGAFEIRPPLDSHIPVDVPKDQIRRVAFMYVAAQESKFYEFLQFLDSVALNVSKKPLFVYKALIAKVNPESADFQPLLEKIKTTQAVGVVGVLTGMPWARTRDMQEMFKGSELFFRAMEGDDITKRSAVVDLVVELMLLGPG